MFKKSLKELSLSITEEEYRGLSYLSYSNLAKYEKGGFSAIFRLKDSQESDSLVFGSVVDTLVTEGIAAFYRKFVVNDIALPTDSVKNVIDALLDIYGDTEATFDDLSQESIIQICEDLGYQKGIKNPQTKISKLKEYGGDTYYNAKKVLKGRTLISPNMFREAQDTVAALKSSSSPTSKYLQLDNTSSTEYLYQTKFHTKISGIDIKCMFDYIAVNHDKKVILPGDLKTTGFPEYDFYWKYLDNRYDIQSRLYTKVLKEIISKDEYFKDFTILPFVFFVINKDYRNPLVFKDEFSQKDGDIVLNFKGNTRKVLRDPMTIATELQNYLDNESNVPSYINKQGLNNINEKIFEWL